MLSSELSRRLALFSSGSTHRVQHQTTAQAYDRLVRRRTVAQRTVGGSVRPERACRGLGLPCSCQ